MTTKIDELLYVFDNHDRRQAFRALCRWVAAIEKRIDANLETETPKEPDMVSPLCEHPDLIFDDTTICAVCKQEVETETQTDGTVKWVPVKEPTEVCEYNHVGTCDEAHPGRPFAGIDMGLAFHAPATKYPPPEKVEENCGKYDKDRKYRCNKPKGHVPENMHESKMGIATRIWYGEE